MNSILKYIKKILDNFKTKRKLKKKLENIKKNDPFIYK